MKNIAWCFYPVIILIIFVSGCGHQGMSSSPSLRAYFSSDDGKTFGASYNVSINNSRAVGIVDPCAIRLSDGRLRMYYFGSFSTSGDPVTNQPDGINRFYSAVSSDGLVYTEEAQVITGEGISDPFVLQLLDGSYIMYISKGVSVLSARSSDGLSFTWDSGNRTTSGGVPGALLLADGKVRLFFHSGNGIKSATSSDEAGLFFADESGFRIDPPADSNYLAGDPNPIDYSSGKELMCYKVGLIGNPFSDQVYVVQSSNEGVAWSAVSSTAAATGSVPTIVKDSSGKLILYTP